jgi:hypothetical protein
LDRAPNRLARTIAQILTGRWLPAPYLKRVRGNRGEEISDIKFIATISYLAILRSFTLPQLVDLFFGITTRLILHRGFVQRLVSPYVVGLSMRNYSEESAEMA